MLSLNLVRTAAALALSIFMASCNSGPRPMAPTQYLDVFNGGVPQSGQQNVDTVSYWDGDGTSGPASVTLDLSDQKAYFYKGGTLVGISAISSGDEKHSTQTGNFKVIQKDKWHKSNLYGDYIDSAGNILVTNIDVTKDKMPIGGKFDGAKMHHFMRFNNGIGMHEGFLPGYAASHGCVRMPAHMAETFFHNVVMGTPVIVQQ